MKLPSNEQKKTTKAKYLHDTHTFVVYCLKLNLLKYFLQAGFSLQIICVQYIENIFSVNIKLKLSIKSKLSLETLCCYRKSLLFT